MQELIAKQTNHWRRFRQHCSFLVTETHLKQLAGAEDYRTITVTCLKYFQYFDNIPSIFKCQTAAEVKQVVI